MVVLMEQGFEIAILFAAIWGQIFLIEMLVALHVLFIFLFGSAWVFGVPDWFLEVGKRLEELWVFLHLSLQEGPS